MTSSQHTRGFTLIELLLVMSIIGLITGILLPFTAKERMKTRDVRRITDLKELQSAIQVYYFDNGEYPKTYDASGTFSEKGECLGDTDYVPGLSSLLTNLPKDFKLNCDDPATSNSFFYASDGVDYKLITHLEDPTDTASSFPSMIDPFYDLGPDPCTVDGPDAIHVGFWTPGAKCWRL